MKSGSHFHIMIIVACSVSLLQSCKSRSTPRTSEVLDANGDENFEEEGPLRACGIDFGCAEYAEETIGGKIVCFVPGQELVDENVTNACLTSKKFRDQICAAGQDASRYSMHCKYIADNGQNTQTPTDPVFEEEGQLRACDVDLGCGEYAEETVGGSVNCHVPGKNLVKRGVLNGCIASRDLRDQLCRQGLDATQYSMKCDVIPDQAQQVVHQFEEEGPLQACNVDFGCDEYAEEPIGGSVDCFVPGQNLVKRGVLNGCLASREFRDQLCNQGFDSRNYEMKCQFVPD